MGMSIDQPGENHPSARVNPASRPVQSFQFGARPHGHNLVAANGNGAVIDHPSPGIHGHDRPAGQQQVGFLMGPWLILLPCRPVSLRLRLSLGFLLRFLLRRGLKVLWRCLLRQLARCCARGDQPACKQKLKQDQITSIHNSPQIIAESPNDRWLTRFHAVAGPTEISRQTASEKALPDDSSPSCPADSPE